MTQGMTTRLLHADRIGGTEHGATHKPIHTASAYGYDTAAELVGVFKGEIPGHVYARQGNPTTAALDQKISLLEGGIASVTFATGMAAIASLLIALLKRDDHVVASAFLFGSTSSVLQSLERIGCTVTLVDATDVKNVEQALRPETRIVFVETIANPRTQIADLSAIGTLCGERGLLFVVDNTMTTPYLFQPGTMGAGLVVNSLTKSICGHGNALGGAVTDTGRFDWSTFDNILPTYRKGLPANWGITQVRKRGLRDIGGSLGADAAHRIATGAETLALRMDRACDNAARLARWLSDRPEVDRVHYPGLSSHPQHVKAREWFRAFGALMSFELRASIDVNAFLDALKVVIKSTHLGDNRTLAIPAAQTIFWEAGLERRQAMGIAEGLIRLSVGIEDYADLQADMEQALLAVAD